MFMQSIAEQKQERVRLVLRVHREGVMFRQKIPDQFHVLKGDQAACNLDLDKPQSAACHGGQAFIHCS